MCLFSLFGKCLWWGFFCLFACVWGVCVVFFFNFYFVSSFLKRLHTAEVIAQSLCFGLIRALGICCSQAVAYSSD